MKALPNILITGTPGTGKSSIGKLVADQLKLKFIDIGEYAKARGCLESYDEEYQCHVLDEDKLLDALEFEIGKGGLVIEYHHSEFFPERYFDGIYVLRTNTTVLYDRLASRGYNGKKLQDNMQCEIFQTCLDEARASYKEEIVFELENNTPEDMNNNASKIIEWIQHWHP